MNEESLYKLYLALKSNQRKDVNTYMLSLMRENRSLTSKEALIASLEKYDHLKK